MLEKKLTCINKCWGISLLVFFSCGCCRLICLANADVESMVFHVFEKKVTLIRKSTAQEEEEDSRQ